MNLVLIIYFLLQSLNNNVVILGGFCQTVPNVVQCISPATINCTSDCINEHGANTGGCNVNNMCVCSYDGDNLYPPGGYTNQPALAVVQKVIH
jgi:hypothetical protein